ncbi:MAG: hypothetical protein ACD_71C00082G0002 [uncultured bacterium (gcode 4)]|uniref:Uncharacterized protein n=1 Tax=uncultured bacterium (gcode 4) TaxID=1234023 RepID=K1Z5X3_9BACT|nr:MAG: hypothetical protein ACD_71C00082G0002 [uncultured bacterium (gcode 4)]
MWEKKLNKNTVFILLSLAKDFFISLIQSVGLFVKNLAGKDQKILKENTFLDTMNFFFHIGPKSFWKAPSGIKIGRSIGTFLHYIFEKEKTFTEKRKK